MKNLIFCSSALHITNYSHKLRENEYYFCITQLKRFLPENFDIVICDNTIKNINEINHTQLREILNNLNFLILNRNNGIKNIGMGELDELIHTYNNIDFTKYNKIVYFTLRKIVTNPWIFEKVNNCEKDGIISNPKFLHLSNNLNFRYSVPTPNLYNDMFFALKSELMIQYVEYSKNLIEYNLKNGVGSEQNLFNFINKNNIDYEWLDCIGLIRIDYKDNNEIQLI